MAVSIKLIEIGIFYAIDRTLETAPEHQAFAQTRGFPVFFPVHQSGLHNNVEYLETPISPNKIALSQRRQHLQNLEGAMY
jgi:hypothetical protein